METLSWDDLRILLAVHRAGSLLAAGKALGLSTSTTARRLDALEAAMGCQLVYRSQSGTELKPEALRMVRLAEGLAHGLDALRRDQTMVAGTLRVSVPDGMAQTLTRSLLAFREAYPFVDLELVGESRMADVAAREADIAVRLTRSTSNVLVEKHLASFRFALFASADYVRRHLPTRRLARGEASAQMFVGLDERWKGLPHEQWMRMLGATRFAFRSSSMEAIVEAVRQGVGLAAFLEKDPRNTDLVRVETESMGPTQSFYLVYHRDLRKQPHVRAAVTAIEAYMGAYR
ncbi:LysR family transcriptional regulator [Burkholderia sp. WAC0059]|uniref:LysR family transcriptional regulator n=1 Tax=Burkholderia sp. WAC0059 TaxID=2066022 RepID=UPI000C7F3438|nr:LysR family transcriptional regulator [Burkholderia sp. WAC0059]PLZ01760.1 LysR family transcriptional regulator [Burkholderia sp. WAC0059]